MWGYMVCVKATKFYASLESLGQSRPQLLEASLCSVNLCLASRLKLTTTHFLKRTTKTGEHFYNFIAPLTITDYNDRGLGPSLCSLFTIREIKEYMPSYKVEFY